MTGSCLRTVLPVAIERGAKDVIGCDLEEEDAPRAEGTVTAAIATKSRLLILVPSMTTDSLALFRFTLYFRLYQGVQ
jgi:hypothetical protein